MFTLQPLISSSLPVDMVHLSSTIAQHPPGNFIVVEFSPRLPFRIEPQHEVNLPNPSCIYAEAGCPYFSQRHWVIALHSQMRFAAFVALE